MRVKVSYVKSLGVITDTDARADVTGRVRPPVEGQMLALPERGRRFEVAVSGGRFRTTTVQRVESGGGRVWEVWTAHSVYLVRALREKSRPPR